MKRRLDLLALTLGAQEAPRAARPQGEGEALVRKAHALALLLPEEQRAAVEARGHRGYVDLLAGRWGSQPYPEAGRAINAEDAMRAYHWAFEKPQT